MKIAQDTEYTEEKGLSNSAQTDLRMLQVYSPESSASFAFWLLEVGTRVLRVRPIVEALTRLLTIPSGKDEPAQQCRRGEAALLELVEHHMRDVVGGIEADEVEQRERTHGIAAAKLHGVVDVGDRARALFVGADGIEQVGHQQPVDDES